jgi:geranylgeranyl diphosphate synthase type II
MELGWRRDNALEVDESDYLVMVLKKTCWLGTIFPARIGALIGTRDGIDLEPFVRFGFFLGAAFQIQDDLLNLVADERYGKELAGDLWEAKRTAMLIRLLQVATRAERSQLADILRLSREQRTAEQVAWMRGRMVAHRCIDYARRLAHGLAGAALHEYRRAFAEVPEGRDKAFIGGLVTWVFERTQVDEA